MMLNLLALLACAKDVPSDSDPPIDTDDPVEEDQLPIVFIEGNNFEFEELAAIQISGTATDRQTPGELNIEWISDLDGLVGSSSPVAGFVSLRDPDLSVGAHVLTLRATDPDGNSSEAQVQVRRNARPLPPTIALTPEYPTDKDTLRVEILEPGSDPEGDEVELEYIWFRDDEVQPFRGDELPGTATVGAEIWRVHVASVDSLEAGEPAVASVVIANNAPGTPGVVLSPELVASGAEPLQCVVETNAPDPDGQTLSYRVAWTVDGRSYPMDFSGAGGPETQDWPEDTVPAQDTALGEIWSCEVWASDGLDEGPGSTAYGSAVPYESYGLTTIQDHSDLLQASVVISVPMRVKVAGTLFAAEIHTLTGNGDVRMAVYSTDTGRPMELLAKSEAQPLVGGVNTVLMGENVALEEGWYFLCFTFSETEELSFKQNAYLDSGYTNRDYSLGWEDPWTSKIGDLEALFNAWILVK